MMKELLSTFSESVGEQEYGQDYLKSYEVDRSAPPNIVVMMKDPSSTFQIQSVRFLIAT